jgi:hypothetical protein
VGGIVTEEREGCSRSSREIRRPNQLQVNHNHGSRLRIFAIIFSGSGSDLIHS